MVGDCGEVRRRERRGEPGPLWQGAISHLLTQAHTLTHTYTNAATVTGLSPRPPPPPPRGPDTLTQITRCGGQWGGVGGIAICQQTLILANTHVWALDAVFQR